jgi:hypothetical protein
MISNENVINYKVTQLFEIYNFCFGHFSVQGRLTYLNFKFEKQNIMLRNFSRSTTFILVASSSEIINYHYALTYDYRAYGFIWH